jgi:hypothetical protein
MVVINVSRLMLIGIFPHYFDLIHGPIGTSIGGAAALIASIAIGLYGTRHVSIARN